MVLNSGSFKTYKMQISEKSSWKEIWVCQHISIWLGCNEIPCWNHIIMSCLTIINISRTVRSLKALKSVNSGRSHWIWSHHNPRINYSELLPKLIVSQVAAPACIACYYMSTEVARRWNYGNGGTKILGLFPGHFSTWKRGYQPTRNCTELLLVSVFTCDKSFEKGEVKWQGI